MLHTSMLKVGSKAEVDAILSFALKRRAQGATDCNLHSSRSHLVAQIDVLSHVGTTGEDLHGRLHLVSVEVLCGYIIGCCCAECRVFSFLECCDPHQRIKMVASSHYIIPLIPKYRILLLARSSSVTLHSYSTRSTWLVPSASKSQELRACV